jgi:uncharacterized membrane protein YraQ (UPF0718 family)
MNQLYNSFTLFLSLLVEAMPFLLFGVLLSSAILLFINERQLISRFPENPILGAFVGSCIGFLFPVCECGNIPVARRLLMQGVPTAVTFGFLIAAPTINPIVIWSTWVAFRDQPEIVVFRVIFSMAIATIIASIFSLQKEPTPLLQPFLANRLRTIAKYAKLGNKPLSSPSSGLLQSGTFLLQEEGKITRLDDPVTVGKGSKVRVFVDNIVQELRELGGMLIIGSAIASLIQVFIPREVILSLGQGTISSIIVMMALAAIVSICSTVDSFFALSFASTFTTSSLLAFLIFGPIIDIKAIGLMLSVFRPKIIIYFFALATQLAFILALVHSYFL